LGAPRAAAGSHAQGRDHRGSRQTVDQADIDLGMATELGDDSLDEPGPVTRIERSGKIEQDHHSVVADGDRAHVDSFQSRPAEFSGEASILVDLLSSTARSPCIILWAGLTQH
jgi:hypothetical protein